MPAQRDPACRCARPPNEHRVWSAERAEFLKRHAFERIEERNDQRQADYRCGRCGRLWTEQAEEVGFGSAHRFYKHLTPSEIARDRRSAALKRWLGRGFWALCWAIFALYLISRAG